MPVSEAASQGQTLPVVRCAAETPTIVGYRQGGAVAVGNQTHRDSASGAAFHAMLYRIAYQLVGGANDRVTQGDRAMSTHRYTDLDALVRAPHHLD